MLLLDVVRAVAAAAVGGGVVARSVIYVVNVLLCMLRSVAFVFLSLLFSAFSCLARGDRMCCFAFARLLFFIFLIKYVNCEYDRLNDFVPFIVAPCRTNFTFCYSILFWFVLLRFTLSVCCLLTV